MFSSFQLPVKFVSDLSSVIREDAKGGSLEALYFRGRAQGYIRKCIPRTIAFLEKNGFDGNIISGTERFVALFKDKTTLIKIPFADYREEDSRHPTNCELSLLQNLPDEFLPLFPLTEHLGNGVMLQEVCVPDPHKTATYSHGLRRLFRTLELEDFSEYNVGWRGDQPVIIDFQSFYKEALKFTSDRQERIREAILNLPTSPESEVLKFLKRIRVLR